MNNIRIPTSPPKEDTMEGRIISIIEGHEFPDIYDHPGDQLEFQDGTMLYSGCYGCGYNDENVSFLEWYERLSLWKLTDFEGRPFTLPYFESPDKDEEEHHRLYYYILDFSSSFELTAGQITYSTLDWYGAEVGANIDIHDDIPLDLINGWLINALEKNWKALDYDELRNTE